MILNCWWERFDVVGFLKSNLTVEVLGKFELAQNPVPKAASLMDLVQQAKARTAQHNDSPESL